MLGHSWRMSKIAGTYRVEQPIKNLKVRVRIQQQRSQLAELFENEAETRDTNFLEAEEITLCWQEKIFGQYEAKFYSDASNCLTDRQKEYHRRITEGTRGTQGSRLFTYTDEDSYYLDTDLLTKSYKSHLSLRNSSALPALRNRKPFSERYNKGVVEIVPTDTRIRTNHYLYRECETMRVVADLNPRDRVSENDFSSHSETILCTITFDKARKTLTVNPDFTHGEFYTVYGTGMGYDYCIEHASDKQCHEYFEQEMEYLQSEIRQRLNHREVDIFHEIELPPSNTLRVFMNLDIISAHNFPYDALFVTYFIDLPKYWSTTRTEALSGRTQRSCMKSGTANFSHVAELCLDLDLSYYGDQTVFSVWPQLLISVASLDSWTRYRIEGYASQSLPSSPGTHDFTLRTWRPVAGFVDSLRRFFTGGTSELHDITYCGMPVGHEDSKLEKSNLQTMPSGLVQLRMNLAHQSRSFAKDGYLRRDALERMSAGTLMTNVNTVLEQFKVARDRMIHARATELKK